jgi:hypothetical protein
MKKTLNTDGITNELEGASVFFAKSLTPPSSSEPQQVKTTSHESPIEAKPSVLIDQKRKINKPRKRSLITVGIHPPKPHIDTEQSASQLPVENKSDNVSNNDSYHASIHASTVASMQDDIVETIRKTVKQVGKDAFFVRLTADEKHQIASVVYALNEMYRGEGRKTTENEIGRIAVNFLLEDYKANGRESILAKVLAALNA